MMHYDDVAFRELANRVSLPTAMTFACWLDSTKHCNIVTHGPKLNRIHQIGFHITTKQDIILKLCTVKEYYAMNKFIYSSNAKTPLRPILLSLVLTPAIKLCP